MRTTIIAMALLAGTASSALAQAQANPIVQPAINQTQEYRMRSAEQMIKRLTIMLGKNLDVCDRGKIWTPKLAEACEAAVVKAHSTMPNNIREVAANGDDVRWAEIVDIVHKLELDAARAENNAAHEKREAEDERNRSESERRNARARSDNFWARHPY